VHVNADRAIDTHLSLAAVSGSTGLGGASSPSPSSSLSPNPSTSNSSVGWLTGCVSVGEVVEIALSFCAPV
jgi:hypothetical protein